MSMNITFTHLSKTYNLNIKPAELIINQIAYALKLPISSIYATKCGIPITNTTITTNTHLTINNKLKGGRALNENDKELVKLRNDIKVCYKCNGRLKLTMTHCRKIKCGKDSKIRLNKKRRQVGKK
ncbi:hypothetical protein CDIK_1453 [Cucumispora dikerogammari]|nr:hypothetical protein CDIK_1453 [Cucumispora dikerogammari]